jgi:hypothetical protein
MRMAGGMSLWKTAGGYGSAGSALSALHFSFYIVPCFARFARFASPSASFILLLLCSALRFFYILS